MRKFKLLFMIVLALLLVNAMTVSAQGTTAINLGDVVSGSIDSNGEEDAFTFTATTNQIVIFDDQTNLYQDFRWKLESPNTTVLFDQHLYGDFEMVLAVAGTYTLTVYGYTGTSTGSYQFQLWIESTDDNGTITIDNQIQSPSQGTLSVPGELDVYTFDIPAHTLVIFDDQTDLYQDYKWKLVSPANVVIFDKHLYGDFEETLALAGTYTLTIYRYNPTQTGAYQFQLWTESEDNRGAITIDNITPTQGTVSKPGELDVYTFDIPANEIVIFDDQTDLYQDYKWKLVSPADVVIFDKHLYGDFEETLALAGTYTLTIYRYNPTQTGAYQIQLWTETIDDGGAIVYDNITPTQGTVSIPGELDVYTLTLGTSQTLILEDQTNQYQDFRWKLVDPGGNVLFDKHFYGDETLAISSYGTHTLTVYRYKRHLNRCIPVPGHSQST